MLRNASLVPEPNICSTACSVFFSPPKSPMLCRLINSPYWPAGNSFCKAQFLSKKKSLPNKFFIVPYARVSIYIFDDQNALHKSSISAFPSQSVMHPPLHWTFPFCSLSFLCLGVEMCTIQRPWIAPGIISAKNWTTIPEYGFLSGCVLINANGGGGERR